MKTYDGDSIFVLFLFGAGKKNWLLFSPFRLIGEHFRLAFWKGTMLAWINCLFGERLVCMCVVRASVTEWMCRVIWFNGMFFRCSSMESVVERSCTFYLTFIYQFALSVSSRFEVFHNYHVHRKPCRELDWIVLLWRENSYNDIACACVTFQSHSWTLCSNKCFRFANAKHRNWMNETNCDIAVSNTKFTQQLWKIFTYSGIEPPARWRPSTESKEEKKQECMSLCSFKQ